MIETHTNVTPFPGGVSAECATLLQDVETAITYALQPIVDPHTGGVYAYEALLRGQRQIGYESIVSLFDTAFALQVLHDLELILRRKAFEAFAALPDTRGIKLFINLDGRLLESPYAHHRETIELLRRYQIPASSLCIELSESYNNSAASHVSSTIQQFRNSGIRYAIDDFGQGISELKFLYEYQPDFVKIDRFFITDLANDARKKLFVSTVVNLAHVLGITVIAEGIETAEEYKTCREIGCNLLQGYYISRPIHDVSDAPKVYPHIALAQQQAHLSRDMDADLLREAIRPLKALSIEADMYEVFELFRHSEQQSFFPVIDQDGEPVGIIHERSFKEYIYSVYGRDLLINRTFSRSVRDFIEDCPIAEISTSTETMLESFTSNASTYGIILTQNRHYIGFLSTESLLKILNEKRIRHARDQNPLTRLPGNLTVSEFVAETATSTGQTRLLCYMDFDNFKPFNDCYSFQQGDRAIILFSDLMRQYLPEPTFKNCHVGGDDFFVGAWGVQATDLMERVLELKRTFEQDVESFYLPKHRQQGYIDMEARDGTMRSFPLMSFSTAIVELPENTNITSADQLSRYIARLKKEAKRAVDGMAFMRVSDETASSSDIFML